MGPKPASKHIPAHRQQAGHETIWVQEGSYPREGSSKSSRPLDNPPLLQLQVGSSYTFSICVFNLISYGARAQLYTPATYVISDDLAKFNGTACTLGWVNLDIPMLQPI